MKQVKYGVSNATAVCEDITKLPHEALEALDCGDFVIEDNGTNANAYRVSFKEDFVKATLTFVDNSVIKTITYAYNSETKVWSYSKSEETEVDVSKAESGTIASALGLDSEGKLVKGTISGGTKLYKHTINVASCDIICVSHISTAFTADDLKATANLYGLGKIVYQGSNKGFLFTADLGGSTNYYVIGSDGTVSSISISGSAEVSDTITEL